MTTHHHNQKLNNKQTNVNNSNNTISNALNKHLNDKRHYCELCNKYFATEGVITKHIHQHGQNEAHIMRLQDGSLCIKRLQQTQHPQSHQQHQQQQPNHHMHQQQHHLQPHHPQK